MIELAREFWPAAARGSWRHVYVIQEGDEGPIKIGIAANAFWRINDLQTGNFRRLRMIGVFICDSREEAQSMERWAHYQLEDAHIGGEWFNAQPQEALSLLKGRCG